MRPLTLNIDGFQSYRHGQPSTIEFSDLDTAAIVGDTGSGKSSILEAMTYCLYGETSRGSKVMQHVMHDRSDRFLVELRFETPGLHDHPTRWRVRRAGRRTAKGQVLGDGSSLWRTDDDGREHLVADGAHKVTEAVEATVGMNSKAFLRTTILPQGRFSRLLAEDDPTVRATVLRQIWPTGPLDRARELAQGEASALATLDEVVRHERRNHPEDVDAALRTLEAGHSAAEDDAHDTRKRMEVYEEAHQAAIRSQARADEYRTRGDAMKTRAQAWPGPELARTATELERLDQACNAAEERWRNIDGQPAPGESPAEHERNTRIDRLLTELTDTIATVPAHIEAKVGHADAFARAKENHQTAKTELANAITARDQLQDRQTGVGARLDRLRASLTAQERRRDTIRQALEYMSHRLDDTAATARRHLDELTARRLPEARNEAARTLQQLQDAEREAREQTDELESARTGNHAHEASQGKTPGDPCPVCGTTLTDDWTGPPRSELDACRQRARAAETSRRTTTEAHARANAELQELTADARATEERIAHAEREAAAAGRRCLEALGADGPENDDPRTWLTETLTETQTEVSTLHEWIREAEQKAREITTETTAAAGRASQLQERVAGMDQAIADAARRAEETELALGSTWRQWDEHREELAHLDDTIELPRIPPYRRELSQEEADRVARQHAEAIGLIEEDRREAAAALNKLIAADRQGRRDAANALHDARSQAEHFRRAEHEPRAALAERMLNELAEAAKAAGVELDANGHVQFEQNTATVLASLNDLEDEEKRGVQFSKNEMLQAAGTHADARDPGKALAEARDEAAGRRATTGHELAAFRRKMPWIQKLDELAAAVTARHLAVDELKRHLNEGSFPKYVTLRRSARLLCHASRHLNKMTGDQYGFRDPRDTEERWTVLDRATGHDRSPAQLSGGEQFLASLALALGTIETLGRKGGRIRTLFVDEGFGSLDRQSLDRAVQNLRRAVSDDHLIVLVSHIRQVAAAVGQVIAVEKSDTGGSRARRLNPAEQRTLVDPENDAAFGNLLAAG